MTAAEFENNFRARFYQYAHVMEVALYVALSILLGISAAAVLVATGMALWDAIHRGAIVSDAFIVLEHLLVVLIFVEILHTVRISIRSQTLVMEPFLIVGLIASVRRVLVITMQAAKFVQEGQADAQAKDLFRDSMIELALVGALIFIFVTSIYMLRRAGASDQTPLKALS